MMIWFIPLFMNNDTSFIHLELENTSAVCVKKFTKMLLGLHNTGTARLFKLFELSECHFRCPLSKQRPLFFIRRLITNSC